MSVCDSIAQSNIAQVVAELFDADSEQSDWRSLRLALDGKSGGRPQLPRLSIALAYLAILLETGERRPKPYRVWRRLTDDAGFRARCGFADEAVPSCATVRRICLALDAVPDRVAACLAQLSARLRPPAPAPSLDIAAAPSSASDDFSASAKGRRNKRMSLDELHQWFPDEAAAERWFIGKRWPDGVACPRCGSFDIQERPTRKPQPYRCRGCRCDFSVKTGTVMHGSKLGLRIWVMAIYLLSSTSKGISALQVSDLLGVAHKTAWHLCHRIRAAWREAIELLGGPVEIDESYWGGKERNKHAIKKRRAGRGAVGKVPVVGGVDRFTGQAVAEVVDRVDRRTLRAFVLAHVRLGALVYTDEHAGYHDLPGMSHYTVRHSAGEYARGDVSTNRIESFWALPRRGWTGIYHRYSPQHLWRYIGEFVWRHNHRPERILDRMAATVSGMVGKRLRLRDLMGGWRRR